MSHERTPLVGGGSINGGGGDGTSFLATINDVEDDVLDIEGGKTVSMGQENTKNELGVSELPFTACGGP